MKFFGLGLLLAVAMAALAWQQGVWRLPDRHNPFAPLVIAEPPNWLTGFKLERAKRDPPRCARLVAALPWRAEPLPDRRTGEGCGFTDAWRVSTLGNVGVGDAFSLSCPSVLALAMWQQHTLDAAAQRHFGEACAAWSTSAATHAATSTAVKTRHAAAMQRLTPWTSPASCCKAAVASPSSATGRTMARRGAFLRDAHGGACRWFHGVLGPDYNAAHRDHFHLETGGWRTCR